MNNLIVLAGRVFFALIFILSSFGQFTKQNIDYAASQGLPAANILVPLAGLISLSGGLMVLLGCRAKIGAWLLVLFLVPVTFVMHRFWGLSDPQAAMTQQIAFMKNLALLGGALVIAYFGSGPLSIDAWWHLRHPLHHHGHHPAHA